MEVAKNQIHRFVSAKIESPAGIFRFEDLGILQAGLGEHHFEQAAEEGIVVDNHDARFLPQ
jgi:hypothetical protein